ncbi:TetR/AcrR family transcriptional regulator [Microbacterium sp. No. 7]|uniref:TetR/AcrR family transcriptional regulator n=1 Tax=Microbacterium sp. No. 7 TaxID=1714373 RepID=UPI0006CF3F20|nr:TetR/AcrR family transcriptional regulator [Microbacterium sp. No. 7]ALJ18738.1 TetR family transcriptional regulator [Microbacterium sp. No. 7]
MARNDTRRTQLADAAVRVLAAEGARGLTHRAVDAEAGVPRGTASNYFATRDAIVDAIIGRIGERLAPDPAVHAALAEREPDREAYAAYVRDILHRLLGDRDATLALFELRLEAARRPAVAEAVSAWQRGGLAGDVDFTLDAGLPGGREEIVLLHYAMDGLVLDQLTVPIAPDTDPAAAVDALVARILRS